MEALELQPQGFRFELRAVLPNWRSFAGGQASLLPAMAGVVHPPVIPLIPHWSRPSPCTLVLVLSLGEVNIQLFDILD